MDITSVVRFHLEVDFCKHFSCFVLQHLVAWTNAVRVLLSPAASSEGEGERHVKLQRVFILRLFLQLSLSHGVFGMKEKEVPHNKERIEQFLLAGKRPYCSVNTDFQSTNKRQHKKSRRRWKDVWRWILHIWKAERFQSPSFQDAFILKCNENTVKAAKMIQHVQKPAAANIEVTTGW